MNDLDLEKSRALDAAATPAPWSFEEISEFDDIVSRGINGPDGVGLNTGVDYEMFSKEDAVFIAHIRNTHMDLIAEVESLREHLAKLEAERDEILSLAADMDGPCDCPVEAFRSLAEAMYAMTGMSLRHRDRADAAEKQVAKLQLRAEMGEARIAELESEPDQLRVMFDEIKSIEGIGDCGVSGIRQNSSPEEVVMQLKIMTHNFNVIRASEIQWRYIGQGCGKLRARVAELEAQLRNR